jgi:uncharacterized protein YjiS (DUF1127 family)
MKGDHIMVALARALVVEGTGLAALFAKVSATVEVWKQRTQTRRELAELSFRDIQDIGLDQAEIDREIAKPFWQA